MSDFWGPLYNEAINKFWKTSLKELKIKYRSPYETRHTFASIMVTACLPDGWVRNQMGHATMKMLEEVYAKWHGNTNAIIDWILKHTKNGTNGADFTKLFIKLHFLTQLIRNIALYFSIQVVT